MSDRETGKKSRILLMSPELPAKSREGATRCLSGWDVLRASDAVEAFVAVKSRDIDLVILHYPVDEATDMDLPNVLRRVAPADYLPIMIVAANAAERRRCEHLDSGADDVVSDSTSASEMVARVRALLRIKHLHDELTSSRLALRESMKREQKLLAKFRRDNAQLQALCTTDPLTHVQNVRSFREILAHEFRTARRYGNHISLMTMDVDHFKVINDTHGHPSGDYVLKEMAVILTQSVRESDVVARTGGDEFSVLLRRADRTRAALFADRIRHEVYERNFEVHGERIHATLSIGIATYPQDAEVIAPGMLIYFSDQALLLAKEHGRDQLAAVHDIPRETRVRLRMQYRHSKQFADSHQAAGAAIGSQR